MTVPRPILTARGYALLAAASAFGTLYLSLVPFQYAGPPDEGLWPAFAAGMRDKAYPSSRTDFAANILLGLPLGFCLAGAGRVDRRGGWAASLAAGLWAVPAAAGWAVAVEFTQLLFPGRDCAGSDVIAQTLGATAGVLGWAAVGPDLTALARRAWTDPRTGGLVGHLLFGYVAVVMLVRVMPLDLTTDPGFYYWLRYKRGFSYPVPFGEVFGVGGAPVNNLGAKVRSWAGVAGLFLPAGLLAGRLPRRARSTAVWGVVGAATFAEAVRIGVMSTVPSATNVVLAALATVVGRFGGSSSGRRRVLLLAGGLVCPVLAAWVPFDFAFQTTAVRPPVEWAPFTDIHRMNPAFALALGVELAALYAPLGAWVAALGPPWVGWRRPALAATGAAGVAVVLEAGKYLLPGREASATPVVLAAAGAAMAAAVAGKVRLSALPVARVAP